MPGVLFVKGSQSEGYCNLGGILISMLTVDPY